MSKYSKEDIIRMAREGDVEFIRMQFTDIFGQLKNVAITVSQIEKAVNNQVMIDGSSIEGFTRIQESDQYLRPDLDSFTILPWRPQHGKVARLICDVYNPDGTPFVGDPRGVLKKEDPITAQVADHLLKIIRACQEHPAGWTLITRGHLMLMFSLLAPRLEGLSAASAPLDEDFCRRVSAFPVLQSVNGSLPFRRFPQRCALLQVSSASGELPLLRPVCRLLFPIF